MTPIPDRFDLMVRKARELDTEPERQVDILMGGLFALWEWHFLNAGDAEQPHPRFLQVDDTVCVAAFTDPNKAGEFTLERGERERTDPLGLISMRPRDAVEYALQFEPHGCGHFLINPGPFGFMIPFDVASRFYTAWKEAGAGLGQGFWIPSMTDEEEDFWQEHGL